MSTVLLAASGRAKRKRRCRPGLTVSVSRIAEKDSRVLYRSGAGQEKECRCAWQPGPCLPLSGRLGRSFSNPRHGHSGAHTVSGGRLRSGAPGRRHSILTSQGLLMALAIGPFLFCPRALARPLLKSLQLRTQSAFRDLQGLAGYSACRGPPLSR